MSNTSLVGRRAVTTSGLFVSLLRWYMRIAGALLFLLLLVDGLTRGLGLLPMLAFNGVYFAPALAAIAGSFERRVNWLLAVVLTLQWCCAALAYLFLLAGPAGAPLPVQIVSATLALGGIIIVGLAWRAWK